MQSASVLVVLSVKELRARPEITAPLWPPMHPAGLRCSSLSYTPVCALLAPCRAGASTPRVAHLFPDRPLLPRHHHRSLPEAGLVDDAGQSVDVGARIGCKDERVELGLFDGDAYERR